MDQPTTFSEQLTDRILKALDEKNMYCITSPSDLEQFINVIKSVVESTGLDKQMEENCNAVNEYKRQIRDKYQPEIDVIEKRFPNGLYTKDKNYGYVGVNVIMKRVICELLEANS